MNSVARLTLCAVLGLASGCEACRPKPKLEATPSSTESETKQEGPAVGTLTGSVKLAPGATLPSYRRQDMERNVLQHIKDGTFPEVCTPPKISDRTPVLEGPEGKLIGVMVAASEFSQPIKREPKVFDIVIKDCRLTPRLVVGQMGDMINLKNEVQFPFMPTYGANAYNETLTPGQSKALKLDKAGVDNVLCGFTAPCGRTDVVVLRHPVFAVSDDTGTFKIEDFPADETIKLSAWHPLFQDASISVKVARGETKNVEFVLTPAPQPPETPEPAPTPEPADKATKK
ncbi:MAG TPA: hypothetical protein VJV78_12245 [Polyangiales bacterium]|nr:hypothetical protein [Polyangiales bacterium]